MIRRFDAPLSTGDEYRIRPIDWLIAAGTLLAAAMVMIGAMGLTP